MPVERKLELTGRDLREVFATRFNERLQKRSATNEIRPIAIMAADCAKAARALHIQDAETVHNLSIGTIDLRNIPPDSPWASLPAELGLTEDSPVRQQMDEFIRAERKAHEDPDTETLKGYQAEAIGYRPTREAFAAFLTEASGLGFTAEETVLSYGSLPAFDGLFGVSLALAKKEGVHVSLINPVPSFSVVSAQAELRNIPIMNVYTDGSTGYCPDVDTLANALGNTPTDDRDILYLTPMSNPASDVYLAKTLAATITKFRELRPHGLLMVDLAYIEMIPKEQALNIMSQFTRADILDSAAFITSLSKLYGEPRVRAGAIHTKNRQLFQALVQHWQTVYASMAGSMELEALAKLKFVPREARERLFELFRARQHAIIHILEKINEDRIANGLSPMIDTTNTKSVIPLYLWVKLLPGFSWLDLFVAAGIVGVPGKIFGETEENNMLRLADGTEAVEKEAA